MIIVCENCKRKFNLPDEKIPPKGARVKCSKCNHSFFVKKEESVDSDFKEIKEEKQSPEEDELSKQIDDILSNLNLDDLSSSSNEDSIDTGGTASELTGFESFKEEKEEEIPDLSFDDEVPDLGDITGEGKEEFQKDNEFPDLSFEDEVHDLGGITGEEKDEFQKDAEIPDLSFEEQEQSPGGVTTEEEGLNLDEFSKEEGAEGENAEFFSDNSFSLDLESSESSEPVAPAGDFEEMQKDSGEEGKENLIVSGDFNQIDTSDEVMENDFSTGGSIYNEPSTTSKEQTNETSDLLDYGAVEDINQSMISDILDVEVDEPAVGKKDVSVPEFDLKSDTTKKKLSELSLLEKRRRKEILLREKHKSLVFALTLTMFLLLGSIGAGTWKYGAEITSFFLGASVVEGNLKDFSIKDIRLKTVNIKDKKYLFLTGFIKSNVNNGQIIKKVKIEMYNQEGELIESHSITPGIIISPEQIQSLSPYEIDTVMKTTGQKLLPANGEFVPINAVFLNPNLDKPFTIRITPEKND